MEANAQAVRAYLDAGVSHARPPSGVEADASTYFQLGGRAFAGPAFAAIQGGLATGAESADWISGSAGARLHTILAQRYGASLTGLVSAFSVGEPTRYKAVTARIVPEARLSAGASTVVLRGYGGLGRSEVTDPSQEPPASLEADLWMYGAGLELTRPLESVQVWAGGEAYDSGDGAYYVAYGGSGGVFKSAFWSLQLKLWETPREAELQIDFSINVPLRSAWSAEVSAGRTGPDPLLNTPAGVDASLLLTWNVVAPAVPPPLYAIGEVASTGGQQVTFRLQDGDAGSVAVLGDFSDWEPIPLSREGGLWVAKVLVEPGLYHFGFLVDGKWHVPADAPGKVTDDFGRLNATLVVARQ